jgi:hypothetical protein
VIKGLWPPICFPLGAHTHFSRSSHARRLCSCFQHSPA